MIMTAALFLLAMAVYGAAARRYMGGAPIGPSSRALQLVLLALPLGAVAALAAWPFGLWWAMAAATAAMASGALVASLGDGDATDFGEWTGAEPDKGSWDWIAGTPDNSAAINIRRRRDIWALAVSGIAQTALTGAIIMASGHFWLGAAVGWSGVLKAPAYAIGYIAPLRWRHLYQGREAGEAAWGAALGLSAGMAIIAMA